VNYRNPSGVLETVEILEPLLLGQVDAPMLGQSLEADLGLPDWGTFQVDPMLLMVGVGILGFAWLLNTTTSQVSSYTRKRRRRKKQRAALKEALRNL
jgi:hypothetical protein